MTINSLPTNSSGNDMRLISNSEVGTWNTCKAQYRYSFDLGLQPVKFSAPLSTGILGHDALAEYYKAIQGGASPGEAALESRKVLSAAMADSSRYDLEVVTGVDRILSVYFQQNLKDLSNWRILEVEEQHELPLTDQFSMP
ncbi:MAG TPA: PD-(D/E)XK nuclease family protein, partial [Patescibacteria group bacterium]|nr:PD-(D/E)XK nuclease family protein [Patescibacteria group bacterium]